MIAIVGAALYLPRTQVDASTLATAGLPVPGLTGLRLAEFDEDALTLGAEAVTGLAAADDWSSLVLASTSLPYDRRVQAGLVTERLVAGGASAYVAELTTSSCAGTQGLVLAGALAASRGPTLMVAAEAPRPAKSAPNRGAAGAAFKLVDGNGPAVIAGSGHAVHESPGIDSVPAGETGVRDIGVPGYAGAAFARVCDRALQDLTERSGLVVEDHELVVVTAADRKSRERYLKTLRLPAAARGFVDPYPTTGDLSAAGPLVGLIEALTLAEVGQRILVLAYAGGSAADAISVHVTGLVPLMKQTAPVHAIGLTEYLRRRGAA